MWPFFLTCGFYYSISFFFSTKGVQDILKGRLIMLALLDGFMWEGAPLYTCKWGPRASPRLLFFSLLHRAPLECLPVM
jgi:hypothetical protein